MLPNFLKPFHIADEKLVRVGPNLDGGYVIDKKSIHDTETIIKKENINKKVGNILALKNPNAIPNKSPIKGSQLNKAIQDPNLLTRVFHFSIFSKVAPKTFSQ